MKTTVIVLAMGMGLYGVVQAADWPNWRGPARDGISTETGWFKAGVTSKVVWEENVGAGHSGMSIKGGKLYTMGNRGGKDVVHCLDAKTGKSVWDFEYPCESGSYAGPRCTPAVDDTSVYVISRNAQVFCLDSSKGTCRWKRDLKAEMSVTLPKWGIAGSPVIEGDLVLVNVGSRGLAMVKATGVTKWDSGNVDSGYASPVVTGEGVKRAVIVFGAKTVGASDLATGSKLWEHPWVTSYDVNAPDPIVVDGNVLITSGYGRGGSLLKVTENKPVVLWENKNMSSHFSTPVIRQGYAYGGSGNTGKGDVRCVEVKSGVVKWESKGIGYASMVLADGKLLMLGDKGMLVVVEATPEQYKELWKEQVLDSTCWTVPTLCSGLIYCRNDKGRLICLDLKGL
jgi:outer membrane protein assembly factor BamB